MELKKIKVTLNALARFELANLENKEFADGMENYMITSASGYFWGFDRNMQKDFTKNKVEKITT